MTLADCHPSFQKNITAVASVNGKTPDEVYALWRKYSSDCRDFDQSAILAEFLDWYRTDLPVLPAGMERLGAR
jgi:hypothetical protein